jgi:hypothetical protein
MKRTEKSQVRRGPGRPKRVGQPKVSATVRLEKEDADGFADYAATMGLRSVANGLRALGLQRLRQIQQNRETTTAVRRADNG